MNIELLMSQCVFICNGARTLICAQKNHILEFVVCSIWNQAHLSRLNRTNRQKVSKFPINTVIKFGADDAVALHGIEYFEYSKYFP